MAAGLVLLALIAGMVGTTLVMLHAEQRRVEAEQAQEREAEKRTGAPEKPIFGSEIVFWVLRDIWDLLDLAGKCDARRDRAAAGCARIRRGGAQAFVVVRKRSARPIAFAVA